LFENLYSLVYRGARLNTNQIVVNNYIKQNAIISVDLSFDCLRRLAKNDWRLFFDIKPKYWSEVRAGRAAFIKEVRQVLELDFFMKNPAVNYNLLNNFFKSNHSEGRVITV
jgi:hypothetical protein